MLNEGKPKQSRFLMSNISLNLINILTIQTSWEKHENVWHESNLYTLNHVSKHNEDY